MKDFVKMVKDGKVQLKNVNETIKQINGNYEIMGRGLGEVSQVLRNLAHKRPNDPDGKVEHAFGQVLGCTYDLSNFMKDIGDETKKAMDLSREILSKKFA